MTRAGGGPPDNDPSRKLEEYLLLYGLSLSASTSLDLAETCSAFVGMLMGRKNLTCASVWLRSAEHPTSGPVKLTYSIPAPASGTKPRPLPASHPLMARLEVDDSFSCTTDDPSCVTLLRGIVHGHGAAAFYKLGRVGLLCLFVADAQQPWGTVQLRRLRIWNP